MYFEVFEIHNTNCQLKLSRKFSQILYFNLINFLCLTFVLLHRSRICRLLTVHHFTQFNPGVLRIPFRIRMRSPVVVVDDVPPVGRTGDVDKIRYRGSGVVGVPKTQHSVLFVCGVGDVDRVAQESAGVTIAGI